VNIAFATSYLYPDTFGGINTYVHELARHFRQLGHNIAVIGPAFRNEPSCERTADYTIYRFPSSPHRWIIRNLLTLKNFHFAAERLSREIAVDRWVSNDLFSGLAVRRWVRRHPARWTAVCHSLTSTETYIENAPRPNQLPPMLRAYCGALRKLEQKLYTAAEDVVALSPFTQSELRKGLQIERSISVIPGGVDIKRFFPVSDEERQAIRCRLKVPNERPFLLTLRRLENRMGLFLLLDSLKLLRDSGIDFLAMIGGGGSLREALGEYRDRLGIQNCIRLSGPIESAELPDYYRAADLFILPTEALEGFGLIIAEAMACGCPVVGTPVGNIPHLLRPITPKFVCPGVSANDLCATTRFALGTITPALRAELSRYAACNFNWHRIADSFICLWLGESRHGEDRKNDLKRLRDASAGTREVSTTQSDCTLNAVSTARLN
jgi:glycosyltransferase involved in cell wall biosynthesis